MEDETLKNWELTQNKFMRIDEDETWEGVYNGCHQSVSTYNPAQKTISYHLGDKIWNSMSTSLARDMKVVPQGSKIKITRTGKAKQTRYEVEVLEAPKIT